MVAGYSTHLYLPIRAAQHPAINEGDPSTWQNLRDLLERKQYGSMNMFVRRAPLGRAARQGVLALLQPPVAAVPDRPPVGRDCCRSCSASRGRLAWRGANRTSFLTRACSSALTTAG